MASAAYFGLSAETRDLLQRVLEFNPDRFFSSSPQRDLDAFEVFCGRAHLSTALETVSHPKLEDFLRYDVLYCCDGRCVHCLVEFVFCIFRQASKLRSLISTLTRPWTS